MAWELAAIDEARVQLLRATRREAGIELREQLTEPLLRFDRAVMESARSIRLGSTGAAEELRRLRSVLEQAASRARTRQSRLAAIGFAESLAQELHAKASAA